MSNNNSNSYNLLARPLYNSFSSDSLNNLLTDTKYVYMETFGNWQLGNQIFQYILLYKISRLTNRKLVFIIDKIIELS